MIWFTSDTHFGHANIIKYCNRPFDNVYDMDEGLIKNINSLVAKDDTLYHLGDFTFGPRNDKDYFSCLKRSREKISCNNIHLIWGNHDKKNLFHDYAKLFSSLSDLREITCFNRKIVLCHYAMRVWNSSHKGSWHLYGHSHGSLPDDPNSLSIDVGVDCFDQKPISFDQLEEIMKKKTYTPKDKHGTY